MAVYLWMLILPTINGKRSNISFVIARNSLSRRFGKATANYAEPIGKVRDCRACSSLAMTKKEINEETRLLAGFFCFI